MTRARGPARRCARFLKFAALSLVLGVVTTWLVAWGFAVYGSAGVYERSGHYFTSDNTWREGAGAIHRGQLSKPGRERLRIYVEGQS